MVEATRVMRVFLKLARAAEARRRPIPRDKFLVLAASAAATSDLWRIAALCRGKVMRHNPQHMIARYPNIRAAMACPDFQFFLRHLQRAYPFEKAEHLLRRWGAEPNDEPPEDCSLAEEEQYADRLLGPPDDEPDWRAEPPGHR